MKDSHVRWWWVIAVGTTIISCVGLLLGVPGMIAMSAPIALVAWPVVLLVVPREHAPTRMRRWLRECTADDFACHEEQVVPEHQSER